MPTSKPKSLVVHSAKTRLAPSTAPVASTAAATPPVPNGAQTPSSGVNVRDAEWLNITGSDGEMTLYRRNLLLKPSATPDLVITHDSAGMYATLPATALGSTITVQFKPLPQAGQPDVPRQPGEGSWVYTVTPS
jgi:hypothetical protein